MLCYVIMLSFIHVMPNMNFQQLLHDHMIFQKLFWNANLVIKKHFLMFE